MMADVVEQSRILMQDNISHLHKHSSNPCNWASPQSSEAAASYSGEIIHSTLMLNALAVSCLRDMDAPLL